MLRGVQPAEVFGSRRQLGRYELIARIGEGGMAEVQLARLRGAMGFEKLVVVKLVHEHLSSQKSFVEMLMQEARLAALVKHPNVVDIYDLGEAQGRTFIAMEYLAGEPMLAVLRAGRNGDRLDPYSTARLIAEVAEGLTAAHQLRNMAGDAMPLVHHDISLGNIMVLYTGQAKLVDFGVAKAGDKAHADGKDRIKGKFGYMAPEKLRGDGGDARCDLFSLGVVLWEALTLRRLFRASSEIEAIQQVLEEPIPLPSQVNGEVPAAFDPICAKALQRDVEQRYQTAAELAHDLEQVLRAGGYSGKYELIAQYMQRTFAEHIQARTQLIKEASTASGPSAQVVNAAFAADAAEAADAARSSLLAALPRRAPLRDLDPSKPRAGTLPGTGKARASSPTEKPAATASPAAAPAKADADGAEATQAEPPVPAAPVLPGQAPDREASVTQLSSWPSHEATATTVTATAAAEATETDAPLATAAPRPPPVVAKVPHVPKLNAAGSLPSLRRLRTEEFEPTEVTDAPLEDAAVRDGGSGAPDKGAAAQPGLLAQAPISGVLSSPPTPSPTTKDASRPLPALAAAVSLPGGVANDTSSRDVLGGWGWSTDAVQAISEDVHAAPRRRQIKPWMIASGAGALLMLLVVISLAGGDGGASSVASDQAQRSSEPGSDAETFPGALRADHIALEVTSEPPVAAALPELPDEPRATPPEPARPSPPETRAPIEPPPATPTPTAIAPPAPIPPPAPPPSPTGDHSRPATAPSKRVTKTPRDPVPRESKKRPELDVSATFKAGQAEFLRGDARAALATFRKITSASPGFAPAWRGAALAHERLGQKAAAAKALRRYLKLAPRASDADQVRARLERLE